eukprot:04949.XXX_236857_237796_1 [CDS] Oithona nana genome sequencing.
MYLLRIKGCGLASMLFFLGLSLLLTIQDAEAGMLMSKGIGRMRGGGNRYKPWDTTGRLTQGGLSVENGEEDSPQSYYNYPPGKQFEPARRRPCVGLCYYEKLLALQGRKDAEREQNETTQEKRAGEEPCVGICQYYRSLGIENPYDRNIKRNF